MTTTSAILASHDYGTSDRVGIWAPNCPEWTLLQYATAGIRADPGR
jgi:fatty-acyl-CoA synthase